MLRETRHEVKRSPIWFHRDDTTAAINAVLKGIRMYVYALTGTIVSLYNNVSC